MEKVIIAVRIENNQFHRLAGNEYGRAVFSASTKDHDIDLSMENTTYEFVFPKGLVYVAGSFAEGFLSDLKEKYSIKLILEKVTFKANSAIEKQLKDALYWG